MSSVLVETKEARMSMGEAGKQRERWEWSSRGARKELLRTL